MSNFFDVRVDDQARNTGKYKGLVVVCSLLYEKEKSYEKVAKITALDRRTVKKYIDENKA